MLKAIWVDDPAGQPAPLPGQRARKLDPPDGTRFVAFFPRADLRGRFRAADSPDYRLVADSGDRYEPLSNALGRVWSCSDAADALPRDGESVFARLGTFSTYAEGAHVLKLTLLFLVPAQVTAGRIIRISGTQEQDVAKFDAAAGSR
jgi:hypothetical protein